MSIRRSNATEAEESNKEEHQLKIVQIPETFDWEEEPAALLPEDTDPICVSFTSVKDDSVREAEVSSSDNVEETARIAFEIHGSKRLDISFGGEKVFASDTFQDRGAEEGARFIVVVKVCNMFAGRCM